MNDTKTYPACLTNEECDIHDSRKGNAKQHSACFQYFCYPWKEEAVTADKKQKALFKGCRNSKDCPVVKGRKGECFRYSKYKYSSKIIRKVLKTSYKMVKLLIFLGHLFN